MEEGLVNRLEAAVSRLEKLTSTSSASRFVVSPGSAKEGASNQGKAALAFDDMLGTHLSKVIALAEKIGGKVLEATKIVEDAFMVEKDLLCKAKQIQKPRTEDIEEFLKPLNEVIISANALTEGKGSEFFNHLKTVADSLSALGWIAYSGKGCGMSLPTAHVEESWHMAEFYNNKILVEYKNKDSDHVEWAKAFKELYVSGLRNYVKEFYPLGPEWGNAGSIPTSAPSSAPTSRAPNPPPAPSPLLWSQMATSRPKEGMSAVFQEITSGKSVTAGLRKVTDDMKSKNRADRAGVVAATEKQEVSSSFSSFKTGPPKFELQLGRKWVVENQIGTKNLAIDECDSKQSVYVFGCRDSVLQVKGKVNNITLDKCTKTGIVFTDVVAAFEIVNCNTVEVQCQGSAPTISIDNTSGSQIYLSKASLETSITTAKSSEINVLVPGEDADDDWAEHPLPQQFVHVFRDGHFTTSPVSHSGA